RFTVSASVPSPILTSLIIPRSTRSRPRSGSLTPLSASSTSRSVSVGLVLPNIEHDSLGLAPAGAWRRKSKRQKEIVWRAAPNDQTAGRVMRSRRAASGGEIRSSVFGGRPSAAQGYLEPALGVQGSSDRDGPRPALALGLCRGQSDP